MLEVRDIGFSYGGRPVLRGLSLSVAAGQLVGVVGPNGSGKTTLLKLITGVLSPNAGAVWIDGVDASKLGGRERARRVAIVPQAPQLPMGLTVVDVVLMGRSPHLGLLQWESERDLRVAAAAMEQTDVAHLAGRTLGKLSGGERQRAVVATALAQQAPLLLLDEPTSNLDLAHQTEVMELVRQVQSERGGAVLAAMHDLTLAAQFCDRVVMLAGGRCFAAGRPRDVLTACNIREVYGAEVAILEHPATGAPVVAPGMGLHESPGGKDR